MVRVQQYIRLSVLSLVLPMLAATAYSQEVPDSLSTEVTAGQDSQGLLSKIIKYFDDSNKDKTNKGFDYSFIGGPYYSSDTKLGIGFVAAGLYHTSKADSILPPSEVSLYLKATTSKFFQLGIRGTHIFPSDRARINYDVNIASIETKFWGIGYDNNRNDGNESKYKYFNSTARLSYMQRILQQLYVGPAISFDYIRGRDLQNEWLWENQSSTITSLGIGVTIQYDSRDFLSNAFSGIYIRLDQRFMPHFLGNKRGYSLTEFYMSGYTPLWKGCILATGFHSRLTYGDTPWGMLSTFGGSDNMRGYFEGRYRDKGEFDICVELRLHIYRRSGIVVWGGAGMVFPKISAMRWRMLLPNFGIGYRWEFKKRVNVRVDLGFGKGESGFIFSINEAF